MTILKKILFFWRRNSSPSYDSTVEALIELTNPKQSIIVPKDSRLKDFLPPEMFKCRKGHCGTCIVTVKKGMDNLSPRTKLEPQSGPRRKACQATLKRGKVRLIPK